ncbi:MAG: response regulator [Leptolyngbya sp.]|nr:MAG: response regulator [Leptolyngbya sp.]
MKRILIVDDIVDNSDLLQIFLEGEGYQTDVANSGAIALAKIVAESPDLVLLDVMMPGMSGYEVVQQIRQNLKLSTPIMLVTGNDQPALKEGISVETEDFIQKPIDFDHLLSRIQALLS